MSDEFAALLWQGLCPNLVDVEIQTEPAVLSK